MRRPTGRLILIGMMGTGKTTVGRLLGDATGWPYVDNDDILEQVTGRSARDLAADGERAVRAAEATALRVSLAKPAPCIVGAAAGTILDGRNRKATARAGLVIWLRARPATLAARVSRDEPRPWLEADALTWLTAAARDRDPIYAKVADLIIDVDDLSAREVADAILAGWQ